MKNTASVIIAVIMQCFELPALAVELIYSAKSDISDNQFLAYGYNSSTKMIAGYLAALGAAPGRTDECKVVFKGNPNRLVVRYFENKWVPGSGEHSDASVYIKKEGNATYLAFSKKSLRGDCDWILPFNIGSSEFETSAEVAVSMKVSGAGNWNAVYVIAAKRARFHSQPNDAFVRPAYLVEGDVIYVYREQPDWYFV